MTIETSLSSTTSRKQPIISTWSWSIATKEISWLTLRKRKLCARTKPFSSSSRCSTLLKLSWKTKSCIEISNLPIFSSTTGKSRLQTLGFPSCSTMRSSLKLCLAPPSTWPRKYLVALNIIQRLISGRSAHVSMSYCSERTCLIM